MNHLTQSVRRLVVAALVLLTMPAFAQLSGTYTIDPNGTGTNNYASFTAAVSALTTSGVSGPVTFNVAAGTYNEQISIGAITGTSATNRVTFQANPANTAAATVTYSPSATTDNWTLRLNGCQFVTIKGLTITSGGTTYGRLVDYTGAVGNITFENNTFNGVASSTSSYYAAMYYATGYTVSGDWKFKGNTVNNCSYGFYVYGSSTASADSVVMTNNTINVNYYAIYSYYGKSVKIEGNTVNNSGTSSVYNYVYYVANGASYKNNTLNNVGYGVYLSTKSGLTASPTIEIENNTISAKSYGVYVYNGSYTPTSPDMNLSIRKNNISFSGTSSNYGIYLGYVKGSASGSVVVENNMIACAGGTTFVYGIYPYHCLNNKIQHNTVNVAGGSATAGRAVYMNATTSTTYFAAGGNTLTNNIIVNAGGGYALEAASAAAAGTYFTSNYNNYYASGSAPFGSGSSTLAAWQTASSQDANSVWGDPLFVSTSNLHVQGTSANNVASPIGVLTDIDNQTRSTTTPDMGADEYAPLTCFGVSGLAASSTTNLSLTATWTSNNSTKIGVQGRIRPAGSTGAYTYASAGVVSGLTFSGLTAGTAYEFGIREICSAGDTCSWSTNATGTTQLCTPFAQCAFTLNMTDSYGDGWNGALIGIQQKNAAGQWITVATLGSNFTSGTTATGTANLCTGDSARVIAVAPGSYSSEVGFAFTDLNGTTLVTRASGTSFAANTVFGSFLANCPSTCPVTDTLTIAGQTTCGNSSVTFTGIPASPSNTVVWMNSNGDVVGSGTSFTTPTLTASTTYQAAVYADNNQAGPAHMGAPATLTGGFGNYTNGTWFSAQKPISIDSITVISNGAATFALRVSEAGGSIAAGNSGALLQQSQWISVPAAGTHKVAVGLNVTPGSYFLNFTWQTGSGLLHRATAGGSYPYSISGVASIDSVQYGSATSQVRVYYAYDWAVSEGCVGPNTAAVATWASVPSTAIPYAVDFNSGLPCNWSATSNTAENWNVVSTYGTSSLNGSSFAFLDDDAAGFSAPAVDASLTSPSVNTLGYDSVTVSFDHYYRHLTGQTGYVEGYNGTTWVVIDSFTATQGSWTAPVSASYDVTAMANADFQVRFRFNDGAGVYGWYWAVDNFEIDGNVLPCTNVRVAITTDIYGSEVSWNIRDVNTGIVWATGGPYADVTPYNAAAATHIDTLCLPDNGTYEFQINDSYGDGLTDGTNTGTYAVDKLCSWGWNNVITGSGALPYGSTTTPPATDSVVFDMSCIQLKNVTFQVDMNQVTAGFTTPEVNGFWNSWCGNCNSMTDANGDGIWEVTIPLEVGTTQEYKYSADAWTIQEMNDPTAPCTNGNATYTNRVLVVPAADTTLPVVCWSSCYGCTVDVTLQVNMAWEVANNAISANGIHVAGDFQGWDPAATAMTDANNDGIYEVTINVPANSSIQYKFINGNAWGADEAVPAACSVAGTANRGATFTYGDSTMAPVCYGKCTDCMASLDENLQNVSLFPNPTRGQFNLARMDAASEVEVSVLDLQGKVLTVATWNAGAASLGIDLSNFANGVYMVRLTSEEGSRTLRVSVQK